MILESLHLLPRNTKFWGIMMCFMWIKIIGNKLRKQETAQLTIIIHAAAMMLMAKHLSA